ncbi:hypothetical protein F2P81_001916 [Scophthalmus maximus]|uniref:Serine/threonine-protein kinase Sgk1-like n=1 Tax=Scophthalmus maximus TaxID=52904 RepID=A0A6A4TFI7_SCOMX|nr:hypothetical protein F2P81_001916 [Scophthalmus maximus]
MTVTQDRPITYSKMTRLVSFFSALLKGKKVGFSDFLHKLVSSQQLCQHLDAQKILRRQSRLRKETEKKSPVSSVNTETSQDLKPENILLDSGGHVMLTDFGLCKEGVALGGTMHTFCGTPEYLAPEVLQGHPYSPAVDWWGLGTVLFEMLYGLPPFYSRNMAEMFENKLNAPLQLGSGVTPAARSLLEGLLERDVSKRLGASSDLVELQEHPFFASIDWDDLLARKVTPPFIPNVTGPCDISHIDPEFTLQPVPSSVNERCPASPGSEAFPGFSYINPVEYMTSQLVS